MEYYVFWMRDDGREEGMADEPFESREEAEAEIERMKTEDAENGEAGWWSYRVEEREPGEDDEESEMEFEAGDYPDDRSVVCATRGGGLEVRRFASGYAREMWEIGMRESDFC